MGRVTVEQQCFSESKCLSHNTRPNLSVSIIPYTVKTGLYVLTFLIEEQVHRYGVPIHRDSELLLGLRYQAFQGKLVFCSSHKDELLKQASLQHTALHGRALTSCTWSFTSEQFLEGSVRTAFSQYEFLYSTNILIDDITSISATLNTKSILFTLQYGKVILVAALQLQLPRELIIIDFVKLSASAPRFEYR